MSDRTAELIYNVAGQSLITLPPEWIDGVPSVPSVSVWRGDYSADSSPDWTATPTVDGLSTTVNVASGWSEAYPNRLYLASLVGVSVSTPYLLDNLQGQKQLVVFKRLDVVGSYAEADCDLLYAYPVSSTLKGLRMIAAVDAIWVADSQRLLIPSDPSYRAVWSYTLNSLARRHFTYCRLVRQPWKSAVTIADLREIWPDLPYEEASDFRGEQFCGAIRAAEDRVKVDILATGYKPDQVRDTDIMRRLVLLGVFAQLASMGFCPPGREKEAWVAETEDRYQKLFNTTIRGALKIAVDESRFGAISRNPITKYFAER